MADAMYLQLARLVRLSIVHSHKASSPQFPGLGLSFLLT